MKPKNLIVSMVVVIAMFSALALGVAANTMANEIDTSDPFTNDWFTAFVVAAVFGVIILVVGGMAKKEDKTRTNMAGIATLGLAGLFVMMALFVPVAVAPDPAILLGTTAYEINPNAANDTTLVSIYGGDYSMESIEVNTTSNLIANGTEATTLNITTSRTGGSIDDTVNYYIKASDIPVSPLGYSLIASTAGEPRITLTPDGTGAAVTGLDKLPLGFPGDASVKTRYATISIYFMDAACNDFVDNGVNAVTTTVTIESDTIGVIGTVDLVIDFNSWT